MLSSTVKNRVKEVLSLANGNQTEAQRILYQLIDREPKFLRELVEPFLPGIISHALGGNTRPASAAPPKKLETAQLSEVMKTLGRSLGEASSEERPAASANHTNAIDAMIRAQAKRRRE